MAERQSSVHKLLLRQRQDIENDAAMWAFSFLNGCKGACMHTAKEHTEGRDLLAAVFEDVLAEVREARQAGFGNPSTRLCTRCKKPWTDLRAETCEECR